MIRFLIICLVMFLVACGGNVDKKSDTSNSSDPGGGGSGGGSSETYTPSSGGSSGGTTSTDSASVTNVTCSGLDDCAYWYCRCEDGGLVNASNCVNNYCANADYVCPDACATFDHGEWTGVADGGPSQSSPSSDNNTDGGSPGGGSSSSGDICAGADPSFDDGTACYECAATYCCDELSACSGNAACLDYVDCKLDGYSTDDCDFFHPEGQADFDALFLSCNPSFCGDVCG